MYLSGITTKEATARVAAETGLSRKELYRSWLKFDKGWDTKRDSSQSLERS
jgi:hypothetical protein